MQLTQVRDYFHWELGALPRGDVEERIISHIDTQRELARLPVEEFRLLYFIIYGYSQMQISRMLDINPRTVDRRVFKLRQRLLSE